MDRFVSIVHRISRVGTYIASGVLVAVVALVVVSIITRRFGWAVPGSYELVELLMPLAVGFALAYTALMMGHVVVDVVMSRFSQRVQTIAAVFTSFLGMGIVAAITWAGATLLQERWFVERTDELDVPFAPFRIVWLCGLSLFFLMLFIDFVKAFSRRVKE
jgi:TRAP-type C4-dicarboxylate transport system permease small subunit